MDLTDLVNNAIGGYVTLEKAKIQSGLPSPQDQQAAIQTPSRPSDAQAKGASYTAIADTLKNPMTWALLGGGVLLLLVLVRR